MKPGDLRSDERAVVEMLAAVWNAYLSLPVEHPSDQAEFCLSIHRLQDIVLARPGRWQLNLQETA